MDCYSKRNRKKIWWSADTRFLCAWRNHQFAWTTNDSEACMLGVLSGWHTLARVKNACTHVLACVEYKNNITHLKGLPLGGLAKSSLMRYIFFCFLVHLQDFGLSLEESQWDLCHPGWWWLLLFLWHWTCLGAFAAHWHWLGREASYERLVHFYTVASMQVVYGAHFQLHKKESSLCFCFCLCHHHHQHNQNQQTFHFVLLATALDATVTTIPFPVSILVISILPSFFIIF